MHFPVFSTDCATNPSHLDITKCKGGASYDQEPWTDTFDAVTHGRTLPLSSRGSCKPTDEYPTALRGPCSWGDEAGVSAANDATSLVAYCWLTPLTMVAT